MKLRFLTALIALLLLLAALQGTLFWHPAEQDKSATRGGDFVLSTQQGTLSLEQLRGKVVILYFGYTWCPDVCPTSLALLGMALHKLEPQELEAVQALFISVDPERDTVARLAEYTAYFHPALKGATGTPQQIADLARRYGVAYRREQGGSATDYTVDHSSFTFLLNRQGQIIEVLPHGTPSDKIAVAIRDALAR